MLLNRPDAVGIRDLGMSGAVNHIQRIDGRASLGVNTRKRDQNIFAIETAQDVVKQTDPVGGLNLNKRVRRMRLVVDGNARRKFNRWREMTALALRLFDQWQKIEALVFEGSSQGLLHQLEIARASDRASFRIAHTKNAKHHVVAARKNIGAQNVQWQNGERSGNFRQQTFTLPRAEGDNAVSLLWHNFPFDCWSQRKLPSVRRSESVLWRTGNILKKAPEQFQVLDNFGEIARAEIIIWHELKVRFDFAGVIRRKSRGDGSLQAFALNSCFFVVRFPVGKISRGLVKQLPNQRLLPIRPRFRTCALTISQSKQHQRVQVSLLLHDAAEFHHCGWVIQVSLLRDPGERKMMVNQQDERLALLG